MLCFKLCCISIRNKTHIQQTYQFSRRDIVRHILRYFSTQHLVAHKRFYNFLLVVRCNYTSVLYRYRHFSTCIARSYTYTDVCAIWHIMRRWWNEADSSLYVACFFALVLKTRRHTMKVERWLEKSGCSGQFCCTGYWYKMKKRLCWTWLVFIDLDNAAVCKKQTPPCWYLTLHIAPLILYYLF